MKSKIIMLAIVTLVLTNCQKTDVLPEDQAASATDASARIAATMLTTYPDECDVINFTNASGYLTSVTSQDGVVVNVESFNPLSAGVEDPARVFNSAAPHPEDVDLGTPNIMYPGGVGKPSGAVSNNTALGNIVVIQDHRFTEPNDADANGATLEFTFPDPITATSIQVIDVELVEKEGGTIKLYGEAGNLISTINIPATGSNGVATISLGNTADVSRIFITINGSMGFDNLRFCPQTPPTGGCTHTQGYWKNHPEAWDVQSLTIGGTSYSKTTLITVLKTEPKKGNSILKLAHQLIAAKLNIADGAAASPQILAAIAQADTLLSGYDITKDYLKSEAMNAVAALLDSYNNGREGTDHCD